MAASFEKEMCANAIANSEQDNARLSGTDALHSDSSIAFAPLRSRMGALLFSSELCQHFINPDGLFGKRRAYLVVVHFNIARHNRSISVCRLLGKLLRSPVEAAPCLHHSTNCAVFLLLHLCCRKTGVPGAKVRACGMLA